MRINLLRVAAWGLLGAVFAAIGYLLINTTFMLYDDEGYALLMLRNFLDGHRLYDDVFSQYGPWPFLYHQVVTFALQAPVTHTLGRVLTLTHWVGCALLCGAITVRLSGRMLAGFISATATFGYLWQMVSEPTHPGSHISLLVALAGLLAASFSKPDASEGCRAGRDLTIQGFGNEPGRKTGSVGDSRGAERSSAASRDRRELAIAAALGSLTALLLLTKINVGMLLGAGIGYVALTRTSWPARAGRPLAIAGAAGLLLLPWILMASQLTSSWVRTFAIQFDLAAAALIWITQPETGDRLFAPGHWVAASASFVVTAAVVCAGVLIQGTSLHALFEFVWLRPFRHPAVFVVEFTWVSTVWPLAIACLLLAARAGWELRKRGELSAGLRRIVVGMRIAVAAVFVISSETWLTIMGVGRFIVYCLPLLPVFAIPLRTGGGNASARTGLVFAAFVALPQVLHAYPVAGSQMGWGTFLMIPVFAAGLADAIRAPLASEGRAHLLPRAAWATLVAAVVFQLWCLGHTGWERYRNSKPLGLPGAMDIRAGGAARQAIQTLTLNAAIHADVLFSRPGMFSFNIWSGVPTPTRQNATHWFWLLDQESQARILDRLRQTPRSAIITLEPLDEFLRKINVPIEGALHDFIAGNYRPLFSIVDYKFLVPRGLPAVPFGIVERLEASPTNPSDPAVTLRTHVALSGRPVSIRIEKIEEPWDILHEFSGGDASIEFQPVDRSGRPLGPVLTLPEAGTLNGLYRVTLRCRSIPAAMPSEPAVLVIRDAGGTVLSEASF